MKQDFLLYDLIRLIIITFNAIFLIEHPEVQALLNLLVLVFYLMNLIYNSIQKFFIMTVITILIELSIVLSYFGAFLFSQYDINGEGTNLNVFKNIEYIVIFGVLLATYI